MSQPVRSQQLVAPDHSKTDLGVGHTFAESQRHVESKGRVAVAEREECLNEGGCTVAGKKQDRYL